EQPRAVLLGTARVGAWWAPRRSRRSERRAAEAGTQPDAASLAGTRTGRPLGGDSTECRRRSPCCGVHETILASSPAAARGVPRRVAVSAARRPWSRGDGPEGGGAPWPPPGRGSVGAWRPSRRGRMLDPVRVRPPCGGLTGAGFADAPPGIAGRGV